MSDAQASDKASDRAKEKPTAEEMPLPSDPKTIFLGGLFVMALFTALHVAQDMVLPIVIALVLKLLLQPIVRLLERVRVPKALGALVAVLLLLGVFAALGAILSGPASEMVKNFPTLVAHAQERFAALQPIITKAQSLMSGLGIEGGGEGGGLQGMLSHLGGVAGGVAAGASSFASHLLETLLILFYMLTFGETFMRRLVEVLPSFGDKKQAVEISEAIEKDIGAYLITITVINAVVGLACGLVMWGFGVPGAVVWGVLAFCLNYVPILGPFVGVGLFAMVGLATLGTAWAALLPAAAYLGIHFAEGEAITPMLLAKRFTLNPIAVMVGLVFWYWLWGVQGAILSVPLLAIVKIMSDRLRPFRALGHLLEG